MRCQFFSTVAILVTAMIGGKAFGQDTLEYTAVEPVSFGGDSSDLVDTVCEDCGKGCDDCGDCSCSHDIAYCCCDPLWTASADVLVLRRDGIDDVPLVVDPAAVLFNAKDINLGFQAGARVSIARHLCGRHDIEFEFFGLNSLTDATTVATPGAQFTVYGADFGTSPINLTYSSRLYSTELNWRMSWFCDRVKLLGGFRWIELYDDMTVQDAASPPPLFVGNLENHLLGFQLGVEGTLIQRRRFEIEAGFKAGVYSNTANFDAAFPQAGPAAVFTARGNRAAFVGEAKIGLNYHVTDCLALRAGYQMMWFEGVALLPEQLDDLAVPILGQADMGGRPIYHGYHVGLQYDF